MSAKGKHQALVKQDRNRYRDTGTVVNETIRHIEKLYNRTELITGIPTGFKKLDEMTAGLHDGDLIFIAGRPSMGKTAICIDMAGYMAVDQEKGVAFFSLGMSAIQLGLRMISSMSAIALHKIRTGFLSGDDWPKITTAGSHLRTSKIHFADAPAQTVLEICSIARILKAKKGLDIIFIDNLQLIEGHRQSENRVQEIAEITRRLKLLARELNVPVVVISQLSPRTGKCANLRPQLSDLREFRVIEQLADIVCFVHRKECDSPKKTKLHGQAEIIIAKHNGPIGCVPLVFSEEFIRFENLEDGLPEVEHNDVEDEGVLIDPAPV